MKNYLWLILICMSFVATAQSNNGYASFIGDKFHGLKMASGEPYDKSTLVAGHNTLPYGTKVKVTNKNNGESVVVTIRDRGPFVTGEIIALSHHAGEAIGMVYNKRAPVSIEVVGAGETSIVAETKPEAKPAPREVVENTSKGEDIPAQYNEPTKKTEVKPAVAKAPTRSAPSKPKPAKTTASGVVSGKTGVYKIDIQNFERKGFGVQIGSFSDLDAVIAKVKQLKEKGFQEVYYVESVSGSTTTYKIVISNYPTQDQANSYKKALKVKYGIDGFVVDFSEI